jgi:hypothetical protein
MDALFIIIASFFALFTIFLFVNMTTASLRLKRSERVLEEIMKEYELFYQQDEPEPSPLPDNIIEFRGRRPEAHEKNSGE